MKRILLSLFVIVTNVSLIYAEKISMDQFTYFLDDSTRTAELRHYKCITSSDTIEMEPLYITIPDSIFYNDTYYTVTSIGKYVFDCAIMQLTIPSTVTDIDDKALYNVTNVIYHGKAKYRGKAHCYGWGANHMNRYADGFFVYQDESKSTLVGYQHTDGNSLKIPDYVTSIQKDGIYDCAFNVLEFGTGIRHLKEGTIKYCYADSIIISNSIKRIDSKAITGECGTIILGSAVKYVGKDWIDEVTVIYSYAKSVPYVTRKIVKKKDKYNIPEREMFLYVPEKMAIKYNNHPYWHQLNIFCIEEPLNEEEFGLTPAREGIRKISPIDTLDSNAAEQFQILLDSANQGDSWCQLQVGLEYLYGDVVDADTALAYEWVSKAAAQNNREAIYYQYIFTYHGWGVELDSKKAFELLNIATTDYEDEHHTFPYSAKAVCSLGFWYMDGDKEVGLRRDYKKAHQCFRKAALECPDAMRHLGYSYYLGRGVKKDNYKALLCLRDAANRGDAMAMYELGYMYYEGLGTIVNLYKAIDWLEKAIDNGVDAEKFLEKVQEELDYAWGEYPKYRVRTVGNLIFRKMER